MEQITYAQVLADVYDDNAKTLLVVPNEYEETIPPDDKHPDELEHQEDFQKYGGSHAVASALPNPPTHEDKTKLSVIYDKQTQTRIINIDSRFRDNFSLSPSNNFTFKLPDPVKNVISIRLSSIELPNTFYSFSLQRGNTSFYITYPSYSYTTPGPRVLVTIPHGNWDTSTYDSSAPTTSTTSILNIVASKMTEVANDPANIPIGVTPASFKLTLNPSNGLLQIVNGTGSFPSIPFDIDFNSSDQTVDSRTSDFGLGYNLGFRQREYLSTVSIQGSAIVNVIDTNYVFITLDPDWKVIYQETPDKTQLFSFAKIIVNVPKFSVVFDNGSNTLTKEYFLKQPTNIVSIPVRLSDPYDQDLDLNGMDFSLSLEVKEVLDFSLYETMRH
jgi:hypothetical protein